MPYALPYSLGARPNTYSKKTGMGNLADFIYMAHTRGYGERIELLWRASGSETKACASHSARTPSACCPAD